MLFFTELSILTLFTLHALYIYICAFLWVEHSGGGNNGFLRSIKDPSIKGIESSLLTNMKITLTNEYSHL